VKLRVLCGCKSWELEGLIKKMLYNDFSILINLKLEIDKGLCLSGSGYINCPKQQTE
jgi:hypothetical protein